MKCKQTVYWIILVFIAYICIECLALTGLLLLRKIRHIQYEPVDILSHAQIEIVHNLLLGRTTYLMHDALLGWSIKKNGCAPLYQANSSGIRSSQEYQVVAPAQTLRIAAFGDSFTHCDDVENRSTWQAQLEGFEPDWEVLNFGVEGFGVDQAFLRYQREGTQYTPRLVLIGFMSENIFRHVNVFRPFYYRSTQLPLAKPRFILEKGQLVLLPNPMQTLAQYAELTSQPKPILAKMGINDYYYHKRYKSGGMDFLPSGRLLKIVMNRDSKGGGSDIMINNAYNEDSEAFQITRHIFDLFYLTVLKNHSIPMIVVFPNKEDLLRYQRDGTKRYAPLLADFQAKGYHYLDLLEAFDQFGESYNINDVVRSHYTPLGNEVVAQYLQQWIAAKRNAF